MGYHGGNGGPAGGLLESGSDRGDKIYAVDRSSVDRRCIEHRLVRTIALERCADPE